MIPKVIHYCWFGGNEKPALIKRCIESWKKFCPDYEIKEWNEGNFDINCNEYVQKAHEMKKWALIPKFGYIVAGYTTLVCYILFAIGHGCLCASLKKSANIKQGNRTGTIAKILNEKQIPTPAAYHVAENHVYSEQKAWDLQRSHWTSGTVYHVLKNEKYTECRKMKEWSRFNDFVPKKIKFSSL